MKVDDIKFISLLLLVLPFFTELYSMKVHQFSATDPCECGNIDKDHTRDERTSEDHKSEK